MLEELLASEVQVVRALLVFLPSFVANAFPVIFIRKLFRNPTPLDLGRTFIDGRRLLGDSKSVEGFIFGVLGGLLVGLAYTALTSEVFWLTFGVVMGVGAMLGDALNSFVKRRLKLKSGDPLPVLDQVTFVLGSYALIRATALDRGVPTGVGSSDLAWGVILALVLHPTTNALAYFLGLKDKPW